MDTNRQFDLMAQAARKGIRERDPSQLAKMTGIAWDGSRLMTVSLKMPIEIHWPDGEISKQLEPWHALTILQYLANTKGTAMTGRFISLSDFRSGGLARGSSFDRENEKTIQRIGKFSIDSIRKAAMLLGGTEQKEKSDLTFVFSFLPQVPMKLNLWLEDDDFPASGKVLFDASADTDLQVEAAGTAAGIMLKLLEDEVVRLSDS